MARSGVPSDREGQADCHVAIETSGRPVYLMEVAGETVELKLPVTPSPQIGSVSKYFKVCPSEGGCLMLLLQLKSNHHESCGVQPVRHTVPWDPIYLWEEAGLATEALLDT